MQKKILIIAPVWNEEKRIEKALSGLPVDIADVLVVDDGSTDNTKIKAEELGAKVISHHINKGVGSAIRTGIDFAIENGYEIAVVISGGGKTRGEDVVPLLKPVLDGDVDLAQGSRYIKGGTRSNMPTHRLLGTKLYSLFFSISAGSIIKDASSGFRAIRLSILKDKRINLHQDWLDRYELEPYLLYKAVKLGYKVKEIPVTIEYPTRKNYTKMRAIIDWWKIFRPIVFLTLKIKK
ncbi:MAG: glycosyltransferase family 2 protein [Candidatus Poribacteria bacterium]